MANEIPKLNVGDSYDQISSWLQSDQGNIDKARAQSIFNMIKEDKEIGDGKISNKGELQMLLNFLKGTQFMPEEVQAGDGAKAKINESGELEISTKEIGAPTSTIYGHKGSRTTKYTRNIAFGIGGNLQDTYVDKEGDNTIDSRTYTKRDFGDGILGYRSDSETYIDSDLDGSFDVKVVYDSSLEQEITYKRDENGNWRKE